MRVLVVGPSSTRSKGGMATVIREIEQDNGLCREFGIDSFESFVDGSFAKRLSFSIYGYLRFLMTGKSYDLYHIHAASKGSIFRKGYYVRTAKRWGKKVILHIHGAEFMKYYQECGGKKQERICRILKQADTVIALSQDWKNRFDEAFGLTNCVVLENGINTEILEDAITDPEQNMSAFVSLGRLGQRKGTYDLIEAVEIARQTVPDIRVYLAGDGEIEKVRTIVKEKKLEQNVEIVGWADFDKKLYLLKQVSTVVLPSYNEGLPMAILEGMACGKVIISTPVGAIPEVVYPENGILVQPGNPKELAAALVECAQNADYCRQASAANRKKAEESFSMKVMHSKLAEYYRR